MGLPPMIFLPRCYHAPVKKREHTMKLVSPVLALILISCGGAQSTEPPPAAAAQAAAAPAEPAAPAAPAAPAKPRLGPNFTPDGVVFNFQPGGHPKKVFLAGNFNGWNPADANYLLKDDDGDGIYSITVKLAPGTYQYKFVADGSWIKDPESMGQLPDGYGGMNGTVTVP